MCLFKNSPLNHVEYDIWIWMICTANLTGLRQRILTRYMQLIRTPAHNPEITRFENQLPVPVLHSAKPKEYKRGANTEFCHSCRNYLPRTKFSLSSGVVSYSHSVKNLLMVKKIQPNLIPSKIIPIGWVHLNSEISFANCHWTWEIGCIWHLQRKSCCFMRTNI